VTQGTAGVASITITGGGSGYTTATVSISGPDGMGGTFVNAAATANLSGGQVQSITVTTPGTGYVAAPTVTITGNGTGATATATVGVHWATTQGVETYKFVDAAAVIANYDPGIAAVIGVQDVAVAWGGTKPILQWMPFSAFQAYYRSFNWGQSWPANWTQLQLGETGNVYLNFIPSGVYQMEWDCYCTPLALSGTQTVDVIPDNWTQACEYYAAYMAYLNAQRRDDANDMYQRWERSCDNSAAYAQPPRTPTYYYGGD
jgi:hypothetical protein